MKNNRENGAHEWVAMQLTYLDPPADFQPDPQLALRRLHRPSRPRTNVWRWPAWVLALAAAIAVICVLPIGRAAAQQFWQFLTVRRVAFVQVGKWPEGVPSPQVNLIGTIIPPIPAQDRADAAWRVHYPPRLPRTGVLNGTPRISTTFSLAAGTTVDVPNLQRALQAAGITDQTVPAAWNGAQLALHTSAVVIAEWPDILLAQSLPLTLTAPPRFDFAAYSTLVLRVLGVGPEEASRLARQMGTAPPWLAPIVRDWEGRATMEEITLRSGPGTLVQEKARDGAVRRVTVFWSVADRVYLLSGNFSRELATLTANSVE